MISTKKFSRLILHFVKNLLREFDKRSKNIPLTWWSLYKFSQPLVLDFVLILFGKLILITPFSPGLRGVCIMQQNVPFRSSTVDIHFDSNHVVMTTENVARLCLKEPAISPVMWQERSVQIDGNQVVMEKDLSKCSLYCYWSNEDSMRCTRWVKNTRFIFIKK